MSRISSFIIAGVILIASVALAAFLISLAPEPTRTEQPPQVPFVQTSLVTDGTGPIPVFGSGTVRPSAEIDIVPQVGGKIVWVDPGFQSGGRIVAGQAIFRIEEVDYQYRVQEAEANLAASRVALLKEQEQASIARTQYELYSGRRELATANTLALREPQLNAARAAFDRDEARLADANLALARTKVTAPFDAFVQEESVDGGQIVAAGQPVARIFATDAVEVIVPLSDSDAALIPGLWSLAAGDGNRTVAVRVVARYGDGTYAWDGYVDRGEASLDEQTRTIDVIVRVPDPIHAGNPIDGTVPLSGSPPLLVGEFVEVEIEGLELAGYYQVPRAALQSGNEVWIVNDDGVVGIVPVQVLQRINDEVYVIGALASGQAVITGGIQFATEGMRVLTGIDPTP
ncbi:MAG: efflux RND transporter periplasmic adaptor subunit [Gemmatimonadetes bacterium]|nr:efflux RND transporter periplasmic adaptor subunit [Gemmatimonadota bacterium]